MYGVAPHKYSLHAFSFGYLTSDPNAEFEDIEEIWTDTDEHNDIMCSEEFQPSISESPIPSPNTPSNRHERFVGPLVSWLTGFLLLLQAMHSVSDSVIGAILKFLKVFFRVVGLFSDFMAILASAVPSSVYMLRKTTNDSLTYTKFVVCPSCHRLYHFADSVDSSGTFDTSKKCTHIQFPRHSQVNRRIQCGCFLLKTVTLPSGKRALYPIRAYPYKTLLSSLQQFLMRPGFVDLCRQWENRTVSGSMSDVYDGRVWKDFQTVDGRPFLSSNESLGLGLMLNVDWFQPFKHSVYSVGAIYLTIMNLPRSIRFKRKNVILLGILPGPSEPKKNINSYLEPLVEELEDFWAGVKLNILSDSTVSQCLIRCALLCIACDLPAGRKLCGFLSHSAKLGCSKCFKKFPGTVGRMDYSGFERETWLSRTDLEHRDRVRRVSLARTRAEQSMLETSLGCRYSILLRLPYFDATRMLAVDPMHNLFLGTGKHILQFWLQREFIPKSKYGQIQAFVDKIVVPSDVGRIPHKIVSGFSSFTADQFKNWIILFSVPSLYGILPHNQLECWRNFVLACRVLCKRELSLADVGLFDALLLRFCRQVEAIYGKPFVTPNMHMHAHLREVVVTNHRDIESQLLMRLVRDNQVFSFNFPSEFHDDFKDVCSCTDDGMVGSLLDTALDSSSQIPIDLPSVSTKAVLNSDDATCLLQLYHRVNPTAAAPVNINSVYLYYTSVTLQGRKFASSKSRLASEGCRSFIAIAEWNDTLFGPQPTPPPDPAHPDSRFRPVKVSHYIRVSFTIKEKNQDHLLLAVVSWFLPHPNRNDMGKPVQVWQHNQFECGGITSFLPVQYLSKRCAFCVTKLKNEQVLVVVPLVE